MAIQSIFRIFVKTLLALLILLLILSAFIVWRVMSGPVNLSYFKDDVAAAISNARDGKDVALDDLVLEWLHAERRLVISADNLTFYDETGLPGIISSRAEITLAGAPLLRGKIVPLELHLETGSLAARRIADEPRWIIGGETVSLPTDPPQSDDVLTQLETTLSSTLQTLRTQSETLQIEEISISDFTINIEADPGRDELQLDGVNSALVLTGQTVSLSLAAETTDSLLPANATLLVTAPEDFSSLSAELTFSDIGPTDIANWLGTESNTFAGLTSQLRLGASINSDGVLTGATADAAIDEGEIRFGEQAIAHTASELALVYDRSNDTLTIDAKSVETSLVDGSFLLSLPDILTDQTSGRAFKLTGSSLSLDLQPVFDRQWQLGDLETSGRFFPERQALTIDELTVSTPTFTAEANGRYTARPDAQAEQLPFSMDLTVSIDGLTGVNDVLGYWPVDIGPRTRNYLATRVLNGEVTTARAEINLDPESRDLGYLDDDALRLAFNVVDVAVQYLPDMPPIEGSLAAGVMTGNSFRLDIIGGTIGSWQVDRGFVHYPQLNPQGEDMIVEITGSGQSYDLLKMVSDSRLQLQQRTGFDPARISGQGQFTYRMLRPARPNTTFDEVRMFGEGRVTNGKFTSVLNDLDLVDAAVDVSLTETGLSVTGYGDLGPSPVTFTWSEAFQDDGVPAKLQATATLNADLLNTFGIPGRAYLNGEVPLNLTAGLNGTRFSTADIEFDLTGSRLTIDEIGWAKEPGLPASGRLNYRQTPTGPEAALQLEGDTVELIGELVLADDGRLLSADLDRAFLQDRLDLSGTIRRVEAGNIAVVMNGAFFDASDLLGGFGSIGISPTEEQPQDTASQSPPGETSEVASSGELSLALDVDRLILDTGFEILDADMTLSATPDLLKALEATGATSTGAYFVTRYDDPGDAAPTIRFSTGDAGFLAKGLFGIDALTGGKLDVSGELAYGDAPAQFDILMTDARLANAPVFAQVLSLASLRGLTDTLAGEGLLLTEVEIPLTINGQVFSVRGARASGPALGLTAKGWVDFESRQLNVNGVVVPSFGVNSALGGIPLIGDLVVGRRGEGIFSLTYSVDGSLDEAVIAINPLSAVTPGVLRRLFEAPERDIDDINMPPVRPEPATENAELDDVATPN